MMDKIDRRLGIGGSDSGPATGLSKWKTPYKLWREKVLGEELDISELLHIQIGNALEPLILERFCKSKQLTIHSQQKQFIDPERPWRWATVDAIASDNGLVEAKSVGFMNPKEWGDEDSEEVPMTYYSQVQHSLSCTGLQHAWLPVIELNRKERLYRIERDDEFIQLMLERETEFWNAVQTKTPPEIKTLEDCALAWPKDSGAIVVADDTTTKVVELFRDIKAQMKILTEQEKDAKTQLAAFMRDASTLIDPSGSELLTYKTQERATYTVKASSFKVMRLK